MDEPRRAICDNCKQEREVGLVVSDPATLTEAVLCTTCRDDAEHNPPGSPKTAERLAQDLLEAKLAAGKL